MKHTSGKIILSTCVVILCLLLLPELHCYAQFSKGGIPASFSATGLSSLLPVEKLPRPNLIQIDKEDTFNDHNGLPYRFAVDVKAGLNMANSGFWEMLSDGSRLWRLRLSLPGALALSCYFNDFYLPPGSALFLFNPSHTKIIGAFTAANNQENRLFATELIPGDEIILEYQEPADNADSATISVDAVAYAYRGIQTFTKSGNDFGASGSCEINVNCAEGNDWQDEKQGVVRIMVKRGSVSYWCTGSLLNNTRQDYKPYLLTADHCGQQATAAELSQWIFYFNYESAGCPKPLSEPSYMTLVGAEKKASSGYPGTIAGSDFYLVLLKNKVPENLNPYYNGWTRQNLSSNSGSSIHHPEGDIKKISTYTIPTVSTTWTSIPNTHWSIKWTATNNGHGVTEGGSSGAPLFDDQHLIMGQLSGGGASCSAPTSLDYYGKFSYSWNPSGSDSTGNLVHWLDPDNLDLITLTGLKPNITYVHVNFSANPDTIIVGNTVDFTDLSTGNPDQWLWTFKGGDPYQSTLQNPSGIRYNKPGLYNVSLRAANSGTSQTILKYYFITVIPNVYPNPFTDKLFIDMGDNTIGDFTVEAYDALGRPVKLFIEEVNPTHKYAVELMNKIPAMIYLKIKAPGLDLSRKVMFVRHPE